MSRPIDPCRSLTETVTSDDDDDDDDDWSCIDAYDSNRTLFAFGFCGKRLPVINREDRYVWRTREFFYD